MACYALEMTLYLVHIDRGAKQHYPAPRVVDFAQYYKTMTYADLNALIVWMRNLPPIE